MQWVLCRFLVMGGECNLLLRCTPEYGLEFVPERLWKSDYMLSWSQHDIDATLDAAQQILLDTAAHLSLPVRVSTPAALLLCFTPKALSWLVLTVQVIRKRHAVGVVPKAETVFEASCTIAHLMSAVAEPPCSLLASHRPLQR